ncbi:hypothetical protein SAMN05519103_04305 [Rhizobiales bacterium GAS113]|nr:hypothetical protein SAMN05519103_04305 [Rhizobiales bacterium GAS113]
MLRFFSLILTMTAIGGCSVAPPSHGLIAAADPSAHVPAIRYENVAGATTTYRPVDPHGWGDVGGEAAPKASAPKASTLKPTALTPAGKPQAMPGMNGGADQ